MNDASRILAWLQANQADMAALLQQLVLAESPSAEPATQAGVQAVLRSALTGLGYRVTHLPGEVSGGALLAEPLGANPEAPRQLVLGHTDTVWPVGTLAQMPVRLAYDRLSGPGAFDMKGGLAQLIFALRALDHLGLRPAVTPVLFFNSDEENGSPDSAPHIRRLAGTAARALVLEPASGPLGRLKTARKGVGRFEIVVRGRAAHAGLEPEKGVSAIQELAHVVLQLHALSRPAEGVTVNVGRVTGGVLTNVVAPESRAYVDARAPTTAAAERLTAAVYALQPTLPGAAIQVSGGFERPPMEATPANQALWRLARGLGASLGLALEAAHVGGGSDGNLTSPLTATLDGLGAVGDGAHAPHEHVLLAHMAPRAALVALLLLAPA